MCGSSSDASPSPAPAFAPLTRGSFSTASRQPECRLLREGVKMRPGRTRGIARGSSGGVGGLAVSSSSERNYWFFLLPGDQRAGARRAPGTLPAAAAALPAVSRGHRGLAGSGRDGSGLRHAGCSGKQLSRFQMSVKVMPPPAQISFHLAFSCPFLSFYSPTRFRSFSPVSPHHSFAVGDPCQR